MSHVTYLVRVLRDFVLQLQDSEGHPITARAYLESALQQQPLTGNEKYRSSVIEKNRIRNVIASVFPQRLVIVKSCD